jgi:hypothetical protein
LGVVAIKAIRGGLKEGEKPVNRNHSVEGGRHGCTTWGGLRVPPQSRTILGEVKRGKEV